MLISSLFFFKTINACVSQPDSIQCCQENPCFNGGACTELCAHADRKFTCTCAIGYFGKFCEKKSPRSCKQLQLQARKPRQSVVYTLYDPKSKSFYQTFCDFTSENRFVWTLLESFRLANKKLPIFQRSPSEPEILYMEQVLPFMVHNEFNDEPFCACVSDLQIQH